MAAAADLSLFAEAGFDAKAWVNSACERRVLPRAEHARARTRERWVLLAARRTALAQLQ
jgi:hypothetical protein